MRRLVSLLLLLVAVAIPAVCQEPTFHPDTEKGITKPSKEDKLPACPANADTKLADGVYKPGKGVTAPKVTHQVIASFSEEARKKKVQGTAVVQLVVNDLGLPKDMCMVKTLGYGSG